MWHIFEISVLFDKEERMNEQIHTEKENEKLLGFITGYIYIYKDGQERMDIPNWVETITRPGKPVPLQK